MIITSRSFWTLTSKLTSPVFGLSILLLAIALQSSSAFATEPGLPFTEEFIDADLRAVDTTANWDTNDQYLKLGKRTPKKLGLTAETSTGIDISSDCT